MPACTVRVFLGLILTGLCAPTLQAQVVSDTTRVIPLDSLRIDILRIPVVGIEAPYSVGALDEDQLRLGKAGVFLEEALRGLPGVQVQNRFNYAVGERLAIRGFGSRAQFGVRGVKVLVDGIPATMPDGQTTLDHIDLGTLGRAEILRGPGSALYGNAAGGVLTFRSRAPYTGRFRPELRVVAGSHGLLDTQVSVSGTAGRVGYLASVARMEFEGFRDVPDEEGETYGAADRIRVNGQLQTPLGVGDLHVALHVLDQSAENPGTLNADDFATNRNARGFNIAQGTRKDLDLAQVGVSWRAVFARTALEVAGFGLSRSLFNPIPSSVIDLGRSAGGLRAMFSGDQPTGLGELRWGVGAELEMQDDDRRNYENDGGTQGALTLDQNEKVRSTGVFGRLALPLNRRLEVMGALRYDRTRFEAEDYFTAGGDPDDSGSRTMDHLSPTVGLMVNAAPSVTLWANVSTSLETPTTTELVNRPEGAGGINPDLEPQTSVGFEVGGRGSSGPASFELVLFHTALDNELVGFEVESQPERSFFRNAGQSTHQGLEALVTVGLGSGASLRGAFTRVDATFDEFVDERGDFSGNQIPGLAPYRAELGLSQEQERWFWSGDLKWSDAIPVDDANSASAPSSRTVDLRAGLRGVTSGGFEWSPYVGVSNVFDERYSAAVTVNAFGSRYFEPGPPRSFYAGATLALPRR